MSTDYAEVYGDEADRENWPYCECNEDPTEDEDASNVCSACGKLIQ